MRLKERINIKLRMCFHMFFTSTVQVAEREVMNDAKQKE
jgi:hypothetical protein